MTFTEKTLEPWFPAATPTPPTGGSGTGTGSMLAVSTADVESMIDERIADVFVAFSIPPATTTPAGTDERAFPYFIG